MRYFRAFTLSLVLHILVYVLLSAYEKRQEFARPEVVPIELQFSETSDRSIVTHTDIPDPLNAPDDSANAEYYSKNRQRVKKQSQAKTSGVTQNRLSQGLLPKPKELAPPAKPKNRPKKQNIADRPQVKSLSGLMPTIREEAPLPEVRSRALQLGISTSSQHLQDVDFGEMTFLNTDQHLYYSYYSRIQQFTIHHWYSHVRKIVNHYNLIGLSQKQDSEFKTDLLIKLNNKGELHSISIINESGLPGLDDAPVNAFKQGTPIPHPPEGMIKDDGLIHIRARYVVRGWPKKVLTN